MFGVLVGVSTLATGLFAYISSPRLAIAQSTNSGELLSLFRNGDRIQSPTFPELDLTLEQLLDAVNIPFNQPKDSK